MLYVTETDFGNIKFITDMTFTDLYLKFENEEQMRSVLFEKVPTAWDNTDPENPIETSWEEKQIFRNTDIVGLIVDQPAEFSPEADGEILNEATFVDGIHVNIRLLPSETELAEGLNDYLVEPTPATPARVWA
jgi:hypothetical protein